MSATSLPPADTRATQGVFCAATAWVLHGFAERAAGMLLMVALVLPVASYPQGGPVGRLLEPSPSMDRDRWFVQMGRAPSTAALTAGLTRDWPWRANWSWTGGHWSGYTEFSVAYWRQSAALHERASHEHLQFGLTPVIRYWFGPQDGWFVEVGIGLNVITPKYDARDKKGFSTTFNFGDHLGVGWHAPGRPHSTAWEASLRVQHFSNASIRRPNPGVNFVQFRWSRPW